jgi:hypothetical protein
VDQAYVITPIRAYEIKHVKRRTDDLTPWMCRSRFCKVLVKSLFAVRPPRGCPDIDLDGDVLVFATKYRSGQNAHQRNLGSVLLFISTEPYRRVCTIA